ncbi:MAG: MoxR family ATPase [Gammaproteobacteria bacterium]|jgi:MoxR-like ATPase|nr:MoxR family ATPase [Gammaproteobacteria bacterium]
MSETSHTPDGAVSNLQDDLLRAEYVADQSLSSTLLLMTRLQRPLLVEGDAGVGKTEIARALSRTFDCPLIRLQCYEGLDVNSAVYEWNYQHQLLSIKIQESQNLSTTDKDIFSPEFLLKRPLLEAISLPQSPVLLIDEIDRADEEFEAFLLEVLSDFQISIPELGTITATSIPHVILTSNGTRELSDALRRRCLYYYVDYPDFEKELRIVRKRLPDINRQLSSQIVECIQSFRKMDLRKKPGIGETLDWAAALIQLDVENLNNDPELIMGSLVCVLKTREDRDQVTNDVLEQLVMNVG